LRVPWTWRRKTTGRQPFDWRTTIQSRAAAAAVLFAIWTVAIEARLVYLQVLHHEDYLAQARQQQQDPVVAPAKRGDILDRNGNMLAVSVDVYSVFADPTEVTDPEGTAAAICAALAECTPADRQGYVRSLKRKARFVYLPRKISRDEGIRLRDLKLKGVGFLRESRRYYPKRDLAAHVLGYVGLDNVGLAGVESRYDSHVRGREGRILIQVNANQQALSSRVEREATGGSTVELTIDQYIQNIAERELRAGVIENRAAGGAAIVMDPSSGAILALANYPTFNPNAFVRADDDVRRNRAVQDLYEPGSTFKIVTASAAIEEGIIGPDDLVDCGPGYITFPGRPPIDDVHRYGVLSFTDVIVKSSNVGAIRVGLRLGPERLGRYVSRFGFGQTLAPDFRGESPGIVWNPARLDNSALASVSMGYQVGVTPIQMAAAVSSIANGGTLFEPHVVGAFIQDGKRTEVARKPVRRTVSERTAAILTAIMEDVVVRGTATAARIDGYTVAGKTGTAAKLVDGRYSKSEYNASFIGFVPSRRPALAVVVVIDSPRAKGYYGGTVAAPVFKRIAEATLRHLGVPPTIDPAPPVLVAQRSPEQVVTPVPVNVTLPKKPEDAVATGLMPDLHGLSAREALRRLTRAGLSGRLHGRGVVVSQRPAAGAPLLPGDVCVLTLAREAASTGGASQ
jgi:cell division protein FtsI (penicillin-binding protein 3)